MMCGKRVQIDLIVQTLLKESCTGSAGQNASAGTGIVGGS
jgi:hypothetical protein